MIKRRSFVTLMGAAACPGALAYVGQAAAAGEPYRAPSPFDIGTKPQLFVDRVLVRESREVAFSLHPAERHPANALMVADKPWEGWRLELFGSVIYDAEEKLFKMWYVAEPLGLFGPAERGPSSDNSTCYATSTDGIHWEKPLIGTLKAHDGSRHNAILYATHLPSVTKDLNERDPSRRYKMICYIHHPKESRGYQTMVSRDGIHWTQLSRAPFCPGADVVTGYFDEYRGCWVALAKIGTNIRGHNRRVFYSTTSRDFETWTKPELAIYPDLEDDAGSLARIEEVRQILDVPDSVDEMRTEFYGTGFHPTPSVALAFPWVFTINNRARYGNQEGPFELQLAVSRDLKSWQRPFRIPCVPRGKAGEWDCGLQLTAARTVEVGDEVWLYYCGANYTHGTPVLYKPNHPDRKTKFTSSIGLAKWKRDRFVSADGFTANATLTTVPVVFSGDTLKLNARVRKGGSLRVEMLDPAGRVIGNWKPSAPVHDDSLSHTVHWAEGANVGAMAGKPVTLRFHLQGAELFAYNFDRTS
ncbi:MAG: hypothetical protein LLG20_07365 [Acidobacteriales bacterium]|nr:hypothetical protein [Terriglobales bacterium]